MLIRSRYRFLRALSFFSTTYSSTRGNAAGFLAGSTLFMVTKCSGSRTDHSETTCSTTKMTDSHPSQFPIGLGTMDIEPNQASDAIASAVRLGYRRIDCAPVYFNEDRIGDAFSEILHPGSGNEQKSPDDRIVKREDIFVVSKLASPFHRKEHVKIGLLKTLNDLRLDYLDLYLIHWPQAFRFVDIDPHIRGYDGEAQYIDDSNDGKNIDPNVSVHETWGAMEDLVEEGLVRYIGVSNFPVSLLHELMAGNHKIQPAVNQVEMHPYLQQSKLLTYCKKRNVHVQAYSPLGTAGYKEDKDPTLLEDPVLQEIASKHRITVAQVCIAWALQRGTSVVVKSASPERQQENWESAQYSKVRLSDGDMERIEALERGHRYFRPEEWWGELGMAVFD